MGKRPKKTEAQVAEAKAEAEAKARAEETEVFEVSEVEYMAMIPGTAVYAAGTKGVATADNGSRTVSEGKPYKLIGTVIEQVGSNKVKVKLAD